MCFIIFINRLQKRLYIVLTSTVECDIIYTETKNIPHTRGGRQIVQGGKIMKTAEFTTRDELYTFLDSMPHNNKKTAGEQIMSIRYTGNSLYDAGWRISDESTGLLDILGERTEEGYFLTAEQAREILNEISRREAVKSTAK